MVSWLNKRNNAIIRSTAILTSLSVLFAAVAPPFAQASLWSERRLAADQILRASSDEIPSSVSADPSPNNGQPTLLAQLPSIESGALFTASHLQQKPTTLLPLHMQGSIDRLGGSVLPGSIAAMPLEFASIQRVSIPPTWKPSDPLVIHIQDVHLNRDAQANIARAVQHLIDNGTIGGVALEGAFGPMDFSRFRAYRDREALAKVADFLLKGGKISGTVYAALTSIKDIPQFMGVDSEGRYRTNVHAFVESRPLVESHRSAIDAAARENSEKKLRLFNDELLEFDRQVQAYRDGKTKLGGYVRFLTTHSKPSSNTRLFLQALRTENSLDFNRVERERKEMIRKLAETLSRGDSRELLNVSIAYRAGRINNGDFYAYLKKLCEKKGIRFGEFTEMEAYLQYVLAADRINAERLFDDVNAMESSGYAGLAFSGDEKALVESARFLHLAKKLIEFSLSPQEWGEYQALSRHHPAPSNLDLKTFENFFRAASDRDQLMASNLIRFFQDKNKRMAILVTGGFHSPGIEKKLLNERVAVVTLTPKMSEVDVQGGTAYLSVFAQEKTPLEKLLQGEKLFVAPEVFSRSTNRLAAALTPLLSAFSRGEIDAEEVNAQFHELSAEQDWEIPAVGVERGLPWATLSGPSGATRFGLELSDNGSIAAIRDMKLSGTYRAARMFLETQYAMHRLNSWIRGVEPRVYGKFVHDRFGLRTVNDFRSWTQLNVAPLVELPVVLPLSLLPKSASNAFAQSHRTAPDQTARRMEGIEAIKAAVSSAVLKSLPLKLSAGFVLSLAWILIGRHFGLSEWSAASMAMALTVPIFLIPAARAARMVHRDWNLNNPLAGLTAGKIEPRNSESNRAVSKKKAEKIADQLKNARGLLAEWQPMPLGEEQSAETKAKLAKNNELNVALNTVLEDIKSLLRKGASPSDAMVNHYFAVNVMRRVAGNSKQTIDMNQKNAVQIFLLDSSGERLLFQRRGPFKRLFADKLTVSANTKPNDNDTGEQITQKIAAAVKDEVGIEIEAERFELSGDARGYHSRLISYDFYAFTKEEEDKLKTAYEDSRLLKYGADSRIMAAYDATKRSLCVFSVDPVISREDVRAVAEAIKRETDIPYIFPSFDNDRNSLYVCKLSVDEENWVLKKAEDKLKAKRNAEASLKNRFRNVKKLEQALRTVDSDDMVFMHWTDARDAFRADPHQFALDLVGPYFRDANTLDRLFTDRPAVLSVDDPKSEYVGVAGGKGSNTHILRQLQKNGMVRGLDVPDASVVTTYAFDLILSENPDLKATIEGLEETVKIFNQANSREIKEVVDAKIKEITENIRNQIKNIESPKNIREMIIEEFHRLGGRIAVRSSATSEDLKDHSAAGQAESFINVMTEDDAVRAVKGVWASLFLHGFVMTRNRNGYSQNEARMAVLLQKFVPGSAAGVVLSRDNNQRPIFQISAMPGLGEGVVQGESGADEWKVGILADVILERAIAIKRRHVVAKLNGGTQSTNTLPDGDPTLSDNEVMEIARIAREIRRIYRTLGLAEDIDMEYVVDADRKIHVVQNRAKSNSGLQDAEGRTKFIFSVVDESRVPPDAKWVDLDPKSSVASYGAITATLQILTHDDRRSGPVGDHRERILAHSARAGSILVAHHTNNEWNDVFGKLAGIITTDGGTTSHAAQNAQKLGTPCVVGSDGAIAQLRSYDGQLVTFDADRRRVYLGAMPTRLEERDLTLWLTDDKQINDAIERRDAHEIFKSWSKNHGARPEVFEDEPEAHVRRRSNTYRLFQLDYYYRAWDGLTEWLNNALYKRRSREAHTQGRLLRMIGGNRGILYHKITQDDPLSHYYLIRNLRNLSLDDLEFLFQARWTGFRDFAEYMNLIEKIDASNASELVRQLTDAFIWMHIGFWLDVAVDNLFVFHQLKYVNREYHDILRNSAVQGLPREGSIDSARPDIELGTTLELTRAKDMEIAVALEKIWSAPALAAVFRLPSVEVIAYELGKSHPDFYLGIESWSYRYKQASEHLDDLSDTGIYLRELQERLGSSSPISLELIDMFARRYMETHDVRDLVTWRVSAEDPGFFYLLRGYARYLAARTKFGEKFDAQDWSERFASLCSVTESDLGASFSSAMADIISHMEEKNAKIKVANEVLDKNPGLRRAMILSRQELLLREDGHHLIVPHQRKIAKMMLDAAKENLDILGTPDRVFDISMAEFVALLEERNPRPTYIRETFRKTELMGEADIALNNEWNDDPMSALQNYKTKVGEVISIIQGQLTAAVGEAVRNHYREEISRLEERLRQLAVTIDMKVVSDLLAAGDVDIEGAEGDILMAFGNENFETYRSILDLYAGNKFKKLVILGRSGRLTLAFIRAAVREGYPIRISDTEFVSHETDLERLEELAKEGRLEEAVKFSEAAMVLQILEKLAIEYPKQEGQPALRLRDENGELKNIVLEENSTNISEYFENVGEIFEKVRSDSRMSPTQPLRVVFAHNSLSQFRTKATFHLSYKDDIAKNLVIPIGYSEGFDILSLPQDQMVRDLLSEVIRVLVFSYAGHMDPVYSGKHGLNALPDDFWASVVKLIDAHPDKEQLLNNLESILSGLKVEDENMKNLGNFLKWLDDQAPSVSDGLGLIAPTVINPAERALSVSPDSSLFERIKTLYNEQRKAGRLEAEGGKKASFFRMVNRGQIKFAVYPRKGSSFNIHSGNVPDIDRKNAAEMFIFNAQRANRPGVPDKTRKDPDSAGMRAISQSAIMSSDNPDEYWLKWSPGAGRAWWITMNPFSIWPPNQGKPADDQPLHCTVARIDQKSDKTNRYQSEIHETEYIRDIIQFMGEVNDIGVGPSQINETTGLLAKVLELIIAIDRDGSGRSFNVLIAPNPSIKTNGFRIGVNGWYYGKTNNAPKAGATQSVPHVHLVREQFPIENAPLTNKGKIGNISVSTLNDGLGTGIVLETPDLRIFIADRTKGFPDKFPNEFGFSEFARYPVSDDPVRFYSTTAEQKRELGGLTGQQKVDWIEDAQDSGALSEINPTLHKDYVESMNEVTAPQAEIDDIVNQLKSRTASDEDEATSPISGWLAAIMEPEIWVEEVIHSAGRFFGLKVNWSETNFTGRSAKVSFLNADEKPIAFFAAAILAPVMWITATTGWAFFVFGGYATDLPLVVAIAVNLIGARSAIMSLAHVYRLGQAIFYHNLARAPGNEPRSTRSDIFNAFAAIFKTLKFNNFLPKKALPKRSREPEPDRVPVATIQVDAEKNVAQAIVDVMGQIRRVGGNSEGVNPSLLRNALNEILQGSPLNLEIESISGVGHQAASPSAVMRRLDQDKLKAAIRSELMKRFNGKLSAEEARLLATQALYSGFALQALSSALQDGQAGDRPWIGNVVPPSEKDPVLFITEIFRRYKEISQNQPRAAFNFYTQYISEEQQAVAISVARRMGIDGDIHFVSDQSLFDGGEDTVLGLNLMALNVLLEDVQRESRFSSYRLIIPRALMGDLSALQGLPKSSLLRKAAIILIDHAFRALPPVSAENLMEIHRIADELIAKQA